MKKNALLMNKIALALFFAGCSTASPAAQPDQCADGKRPDNITQAGGNGVCMAIKVFSPAAVDARQPLIVLTHSDNGGSMTGDGFPTLARTISERFNSITIFMLRPGYRGNFGKSDGYANREDDDYSKANVEYMARALRDLRQAHPGKKVVMVGHSGGAAMTGLLLALHPELIEAAVLAGCPCDVGPWRRWRATSAGKSNIPWTNSLSPLDNTKQVSKRAVVIAITGEKDNNTLPQFSQTYIAALQRYGVEKAQFVLAAGATHVAVLRAPEFFEAIQSAVRAVSNSPD